jgi:hypothetical protein
VEERRNNSKNFVHSDNRPTGRVFGSEAGVMAAVQLEFAQQARGRCLQAETRGQADWCRVSRLSTSTMP